MIKQHYGAREWLGKPRYGVWVWHRYNIGGGDGWSWYGYQYRMYWAGWAGSGGESITI